MLKILKLVGSCGECPNRQYYSGNQYRCSQVDEVIANKDVVASFCPLSEFPSRTLADQDSTIRLLREPNKYGLVFAILSHIATKLKTTVDERGMVRIPLKDSAELYIRHDYITMLSVNPGTEVQFIYDGGKVYKLHPDAHPPVLYEEVSVEGVEGLLWTKIDLA